MKKNIILVLVALLLISLSGLAADAKVFPPGSSVVKIGEDINVGEKLTFKELVSIKGNINVKGQVDKDVVSVLGTVHLFPSAKVGGDVIAASQAPSPL